MWFMCEKRTQKAMREINDQTQQINSESFVCAHPQFLHYSFDDDNNGMQSPSFLFHSNKQQRRKSCAIKTRERNQQLPGKNH